MNKFPNDRIKEIQLQTEIFEFPIPLMCVRPINDSNKSDIFIFNGGIGQTNSLSVYLNNAFFDNHYFISYEKMWHGKNKNKPSQFKSKYIKELDCVVEWAKKEFPNKRIFLLGESWGSAINFVYLEEHSNKVDGVINWNMPTKVINTQKKSFKRVWVSAWKEIATILFNANLKLPLEANHRDPLTQNEVLKRVSVMTHNETASSNSRLTLSVWRYFRPSKKFLLKNCGNDTFKFLYIQSMQDALINQKLIEKLKRISNGKHLIFIEKGYHILSFEPIESNELFDIIKNYINQN